MNRQAILENFVRATHGKGRGKEKDISACSYFPEDHPGCAIGSQPGFREQFEGRMSDEDDIRDWMDEECDRAQDNPEISKDLLDFFEVDVNTDDIDFLTGVQCFHDQERNWNGKRELKQSSLEAFAEEWELTAKFSRVKSS